MATPLTQEEEKRYTSLIDGILATADLETVTRKKIRAGLETALGGKDLTDQKNAIKDLIEQRFDALSSAEPAQASSASPHASEANGQPEEEEDEIRVSVPAPKKKRKAEDTEDADAKLAAMLQAQENSSRTRATRGGSASKPKKMKATPKKKSAKKVKPEDDSDVDGDSSESAPKKKAGGGFQKPFNLSDPLAEVCGETQLSRPQVVKKLWEYIRAEELQVPDDKRQIRCDDRLQAVFGVSMVNMFQMNKFLGKHLYPVDEE